MSMDQKISLALAVTIQTFIVLAFASAVKWVGCNVIITIIITILMIIIIKKWRKIKSKVISLGNCFRAQRVVVVN